MSMQAVRDRYGVPAFRGARVTYGGKPGWITSAPGMHLNLLLDGDKRTSGPYHPLWEIDYLDGVDYAGRYDARVESFNRALSSSRSGTP